jgi:hypothetical protein
MRTKCNSAFLFVLLIGCIQLATCTQKPQKADRVRIPDAKGSQLEEAYKQYSKEKLLQFFNNWNDNSVAVNERDLMLLSSLKREAYGAFSAFYKPHKLDSLGGSEWGNDVYQKTKFLLVQADIKIYATDRIFYSDAYIDSVITRVITKTVREDSVKQRRLKKINGRLNQQIREEFGFETPFSFHNQRDAEKAIDSIESFRPVIKVPGKQVVYLTPKREETLKAFLGDKHLPLGAGGIMNPASSSGESDKRKKFLENAIKIWYGHWGGYWQLNSCPVAYSITFDKNLLYARIDFRMVYEGGEAILKKTNGQWTLLSSRRTWIE